MDIRRYPIPKTRDPFINTPFVRAGFDPETGEERFWTGSWNANVGMTGALVTPSGKNRIYRFDLESKVLSPIAPFPAELDKLYHTGRQNEYVVLLKDGTVQLWQISRAGITVTKTILKDEGIIHIFPTRANGEFVLCASKTTEFYVIRDLLN